MTQKEMLLDQMAVCRNQKAWFVPLSDALAGLSAEQAAWQDGTENHSILEIVNHVIFWNERWLMKFKGITPPEMKGENSATFTASDSDWELVVRRVDELLGEWENTLRDAGEEKLARQEFQDSWYAILSQLTIHNAYHIGQIVYMRKLQGSWDSDQGVK